VAKMGLTTRTTVLSSSLPKAMWSQSISACRWYQSCKH
jgi:hypothetical protein